MSDCNYDITWIIPRLRNPVLPKFLWNICSWFTGTAVSCLTKLFIKYFNKPLIYNVKSLHCAVSNRPKTTPLVTVSNHDSCFDDPGLWGNFQPWAVVNWFYSICRSLMMILYLVMLPWKSLLQGWKTRWSMAAHDICFTNTYHSYFFMLGKCVPTVRGEGVFQEAVNYCIEILSRGEWLHVFPEGKVNMTKEHLRLKWGIGRIIYESPVMPIVIPIWHMGMEEVLPNYPPYYLRTGKKVTINVGEPINLEETILKLRKENVSDIVARKTITDKIQYELFKLRDATAKLHNKRIQS